MTKPKSKSLTSVEDMTLIKDLRSRLIGKKITVMGRDITLGPNEAEPVLLTGHLDSFRMNSERTVIVMRILQPRVSFARPRVVEVVL